MMDLIGRTACEKLLIHAYITIAIILLAAAWYSSDTVIASFQEDYRLYVYKKVVEILIII